MENYPREYVDYLVQFHATRDYFECHEIMEKYWKKTPESPLAKVWMGLIQVAVSMYHQRRGNRAGAAKMMESAISNLDDAGLAQLGIDPGAFIGLLKERAERLHSKERLEYTDLDIPLNDLALVRFCRERAEESGGVWLGSSRMSDDSLIHRHALRDRSDVIDERKKSFEKRKPGGKAE